MGEGTRPEAGGDDTGRHPETGDGIVLDAARIEDLDALVAFNRGIARESEGLELDEPTVRAGLAAMLRDPGRGAYLVARGPDGVPVGQVMITHEWSDWRNAWFWWIQSVYVRPDMRGRGIYARLHREIAARARVRGDVCGLRLYVAHGNVRAQAAYEALGMSPAAYRMYEVSFNPPEVASGT